MCVVFLHEEGAEDDAGEVEPGDAHALSAGELPEDGEDESSGAVPAVVDAEDDGGEGDHALGLQSIVQAVVGEVGEEHVAADDAHVVYQEGS